MGIISHAYILMLTFVYLSVTVGVHGANEWNKYTPKNGWKVIDKAYRVDLCLTKYACIMMCGMTSECLVVSYDEIASSCAYYKSGKLYLQMVTNPTTFVRVRHVSVLHVHYGSQPYQLDFMQAGQVCSSLGGRLMTLSELYDAYLEGYQMCSYGWVAEAQAVYPMQIVRPNCGSNIGLITASSSRANAWCTFN